MDPLARCLRKDVPVTADRVAQYRHNLAAVSEGTCPVHRIALRETGWCTACGYWWSVRHEPDAEIGGPLVVETFPFPQAGRFPES